MQKQPSSRGCVDRKSISQLLETQYPGLLRSFRRKAQDPQLAADLLNDAIVVALEHLQNGRLADPTQIAGYVFQVALNLYRNHRRKHAERADKRADAVDLENCIANTPQELDWHHPVLRLLQELPVPRDRLLLKRFYLDEEDKDAICRELNISALHFDKVIFRAKRRMLSLLEARGMTKQDLLGIAFLGLAAAYAWLGR